METLFIAAAGAVFGVPVMILVGLFLFHILMIPLRILIWAADLLQKLVDNMPATR